jgi:hypothetical protein
MGKPNFARLTLWLSVFVVRKAGLILFNQSHPVYRIAECTRKCNGITGLFLK